MLRPEKMLPTVEGLTEKVWQAIDVAAEATVQAEPSLRGMLEDVVLSRGSLLDAVSARRARKLSRRAHRLRHPAGPRRRLRGG